MKSRTVQVLVGQPLRTFVDVGSGSRLARLELVICELVTVALCVKNRYSKGKQSSSCRVRACVLSVFEIWTGEKIRTLRAVNILPPTSLIEIHSHLSLHG